MSLKSKNEKKKITLGSEPKVKSLKDFMNGAKNSEFDFPDDSLNDSIEEKKDQDLKNTKDYPESTSTVENNNADTAYKAEKEPVLPWNMPGVRADLLLSPMRIILPEPYVLKLKYIANNTKYSQQAFVRECVIKRIDEMLEELI